MISDEQHDLQGVFEIVTSALLRSLLQHSEKNVGRLAYNGLFNYNTRTMSVRRQLPDRHHESEIIR